MTSEVIPFDSFDIVLIHGAAKRENTFLSRGFTLFDLIMHFHCSTTEKKYE